MKDLIANSISAERFRRLSVALIVLCFVALIAFSRTNQAQEPVTPLPRAHAHNDYRHARPLLDALDHGFCSVEADIFLVDGELLVAHNIEDVTPERTLRSLYLESLSARVEANHGSVYPNANSDANSDANTVEGHGDGRDTETSAYEFTLLIDIKSEGASTYAALRVELEEYRNMLTKYRDGAVERGAVTVILSGDRPREILESEPVRLCAIDGRLADLEGNAPASLIPLVSQNWRDVFKWRGRGPMPEAEREKLRAYADRAHAQGRRLRFWATPARETVWSEQLDAGVDLVNTDHLAWLRDFLLAQ